MTKSRKRTANAEEGDLVLGASSLERLSRIVREHPVTTLALSAGVGALMGAELLAAGLVGGAAVLLLQRSELRARARSFVESARERISAADGAASAHDA